MSLTYTEARDEIMAKLKAAFDSVPISSVHYPDMAFTIPSGSVAWARVTYDVLGSNQASFSDGSTGRKWRRNGIIGIQLFYPLGGGSTDAWDAAKVVADAFEGKTTPGGVWFREILGPNAIGPSGGFSQVNMTIAFNYDEIK